MKAEKYLWKLRNPKTTMTKIGSLDALITTYTDIGKRLLKAKERKKDKKVL